MKTTVTDACTVLTRTCTSRSSSKAREWLIPFAS